jgi:pyruvate dehydrogenase E1 component beta subunit
MPEVSYIQAVRETLSAEMRANPRVIVLCEDDGAPLSAVAAALLAEFGGERVRTVRGSAGVIAGAAIGAAACGCRPVVELRRAATLAGAVPLFEGALERARLVSPATEKAVLAVRAPADAGAQLLNGWFSPETPLRIAAPAAPADAAGLLRSALRAEEGPTLLLEDAALQNLKGAVAADGVTPFGVAACLRTGADVTVAAFGRATGLAAGACEIAARSAQVDAELLDLRTLAPLDLEAVLASLHKTGRLLLCSAAPARAFTNALAAAVMQRAFDDLDAPVHALCSSDEKEIAAAIAALAQE